MTKFLLVMVLACSTLISATPFAAESPFFLHGDGRLQIRNQHNGRTADVTYLNADGSLNDEAFRTIDRVFGFPTDVMGENISRRTVAFLDYFSDRHAQGKVVQLVSGYRSQDYNNMLRRRGATAAKTSTHIDGMAIDFSLPGVNGKMLWEDMRLHECCGAGFYHGNVVHLDSGRPRFWMTETAKVHSGESDFNRYIYASTEYDRYPKASRMRLLFTSVSDFGFGVKAKASLVKEGDDRSAKAGEVVVALGTPAGPTPSAADECLPIQNRKDGRFLWATLPEKIKPGRYRVKIDFCNKPFAEMPDDRLTNPIEITRP